MAGTGGTRVLPHDLVGQFILCKSESYIPRGWDVRKLGAWWLASHSRLPVIDVVAPDGSWQGWLLGYPITPDGRLLASGVYPSGVPGGADGSAGFERTLYALGGRFAGIYFGPEASRVYLDSYGSLAVVFCPTESIVASSPTLIPNSAETPDNQALIRAVGSLEEDGWFPFGLTPRRGIERLLPNHALDLATWEAVRHWPGPGQFRINSDIASAVSETAAIVENHIAAVARAYPIQMSLTSGRHTRMLLACARRWLSRIVFFTVPVPDADGDLDSAVAQRIAKRFGLSYLRLNWQEPTDAELEGWRYVTGGCVGGRVMRSVRTFRQLDANRAIMSATTAEIGRSLWRREDVETSRLPVATLLHRLKTPAVPEIVERAERWLAGVPAEDVFQTLDLLHLEQRFTSWGGTQEYGNVQGVLDMTAFSHRRLVELQLALPRDYRREDRLPRDLIKMRWPELLEFPFNQYVGLKRVLQVSAHKWRSACRRLSSVLRGARDSSSTPVSQ